jgi:hypothetical protein
LIWVALFRSRGRLKAELQAHCPLTFKIMSNLSDIGFPTPDETAVNEMIIHVLEVATPVQNPRGFYLTYSDPSGAEVYLQGNFEQELVGFNPHFAGSGKMRVDLLSMIERDSSDFDGGFHARFGETEFVFDAPDFRMVAEGGFPREVELQLTAFASNDFKIIPSFEQLFESVPPPEPEIPARPVAKIAAEIVGFEKRKNELSGEEFYWIQTRSGDAEIDVVSDLKWITGEIKTGDFVTGTFWLSGRF